VPAEKLFQINPLHKLQIWVVTPLIKFHEQLVKTIQIIFGNITEQKMEAQSNP